MNRVTKRVKYHKEKGYCGQKKLKTYHWIKIKARHKRSNEARVIHEKK